MKISKVLVSLTTVMLLGMMATVSAEEQKTKATDIQPTVGTVYEDPYLDNFGGNILGVASQFHIFAEETKLSADTNGNIATNFLHGKSDFGTRGYTGDPFYIREIAPNGLLSNSFRATDSQIVIGPNEKASVNGSVVTLGGVTLTNVPASNVYRDVNDDYLDVTGELNKLANKSVELSNIPDSAGVKYDFSDMNNRTVDISGAIETQANPVYVTVPFEYLEAAQPIKIKGMTGINNPLVILNVSGVKNSGHVATEVQLFINGSGKPLNNQEWTNFGLARFLWNFGTTGNSLNFNSGRFMGSVLAPRSDITVGVNVDGNIIGKSVHIVGGESHRWDLQPHIPTPPIDSPDPETSTTDSSSTTETSSTTKPSSSEPETSTSTTDSSTSSTTEPSTSTSTTDSSSSSTTPPPVESSTTPPPATPEDEQEQPQENLPQTGDNTNTTLIALGVVALIVAVIAYFGSKRYKSHKED